LRGRQISPIAVSRDVFGSEREYALMWRMKVGPAVVERSRKDGEEDEMGPSTDGGKGGEECSESGTDEVVGR